MIGAKFPSLLCFRGLHTPTHTHTYTRTHTHTHAHTPPHTHAHARTHTAHTQHTRAHTHTPHTHTHTHSHTTHSRTRTRTFAHKDLIFKFTYFLPSPPLAMASLPYIPDFKLHRVHQSVVYYAKIYKTKKNSAL